jgi:leucyl aminopeptidase
VTSFDLIDTAEAATPVHLVPRPQLEDWLSGQPEHVRNWLDGRTESMKSGGYSRLPGTDGRTSGMLWVLPEKPDIWSIAGLQKRLWDANFQLDLTACPEVDTTLLCTGWALGSYHFDRYLKDDGKPAARLVWPDNSDRKQVLALAEGICFARDLVNTPADDMGPSELEDAARAIAERFDGNAASVVGDELLAKNFPMIHAVGRASDDPPRLIDLTFGDPDAPKVTLVGKGVCFDTGGLDLKPASGMELMRKDMGGAATVLGLAHVLLSLGAPIRLRVLVPAVENAIAGNAYRPGDILQTRQGITVEIGNTDAEGRLVLGDALTLASEDDPDLLIDFATLTGAARVAVGTEIAAYFTRNNDLGDEVMFAGRAAADPVWRLPMHQAYRHMLDTPFADINNAGTGRFAGATTAALFLKEFVAKPENWVHFDIMAWNSRARAGRPKGGEAMGLRAVLHLIMERYA